MNVLWEILKYFILFFSILMARSVNSDFAAPVYEASFENLGIPLQSRYEDGQIARTSWDLEVFDNKLFVGSGDYDTNQGPVAIYAYDIENDTWVNTGTLPDEQAERMYLFNDTLVIPGCDPRDSWEWGNLYFYKNGSWVIKRNIPGGIHQFDIAQFDGRIFVGLGVSPGSFPIAVSDDGCNTFQSVQMYKDGKLVVTIAEDGSTSNTTIRVKDFFILNDSLYAFYYQYLNQKLTTEIYRYQDGAFYYHSSMPQNLSYQRTTYELFNAKEQIQNRLYFTTGRLYVTDDMNTVDEIKLGKHEIITDLRIIDGNLYVCSIDKNNDGTYRTTLWIKNPYHPTNFKKLFYFSFACPSQCFTYHNGTFYFGTGEGILSDGNSENGTILSVKHSIKNSVE